MPDDLDVGLELPPLGSERGDAGVELHELSPGLFQPGIERVEAEKRRVRAIREARLGLAQRTRALARAGAFRASEGRAEDERNCKRQPERQAALPSPQHRARP